MNDFFTQSLVFDTLAEYLAFVERRFHQWPGKVNAGASCPECWAPGGCEHGFKADFADVAAAIGVDNAVNVQRGLTRIV